MTPRIHETAARAKKVLALIGTIEVHLAPRVREQLVLSGGLSRAPQALALALREKQHSADWWTRLAIIGGCKPPSATTIAAVLDHYDAVARGAAA